MTLSRITTHVADGLDRVITQYRGKPRLKAWISAYLKQCQLLEDATYDVIIGKMIDNAVGPRLDMLGKIVGELRNSQTDDVYRVFIRARIRINRSRGNTQDMLDVLGIITETDLEFREFQPAAFYIEMLAVPDHDPVLLYTELRDTKAGGVKLTLVVPTDDDMMLLARDAGDSDVFAHSAGNGNPDIVTTEDWGFLSDAVTLRAPGVVPTVRLGAPRISYVSPTTGPDSGGTALSIHGSGFRDASAVRLHPSSASPTNVDSVVVVNDSLITCTTRVRDTALPRTLRLRVTTPHGTGVKNNAFIYHA